MGLSTRGAWSGTSMSVTPMLTDKDAIVSVTPLSRQCHREKAEIRGQKSEIRSQRKERRWLRSLLRLRLRSPFPAPIFQLRKNKTGYSRKHSLGQIDRPSTGKPIPGWRQTRSDGLRKPRGFCITGLVESANRKEEAMEGTLTKPSPQRCADSPRTLESLIEEWVAKLAVNAGAALDAKTQAVYCSIWLEGLGDLTPNVLRAAFQKTLQECAYWPVKVADIRKHVARAESHATEEAAEIAWERVLELRRVYWSPDMSGGFSRGMPKLPERVAQAARAAGIWRDFPTTEALHVWAKKVFFESFIAWGKAEQDQFLLPDGEIKNLLAEFYETKALPAPQVCFEDLHKRGLQY